MLNPPCSESDLQLDRPRDLVMGSTTRFPRPRAGTSPGYSSAGLAALVAGISGGVGAVRTTNAGVILVHTLGLDPTTAAALAQVAVGGWRWAREGGHLGGTWYWARRTHGTQAMVTALDDSCLLVVSADATAALDTMRSALKTFAASLPRPCVPGVTPFTAGRSTGRPGPATAGAPGSASPARTVPATTGSRKAEQ